MCNNAPNVAWYFYCSQTISSLTHMLLLFSGSPVQLFLPNSNAVYSEFPVLICTVHDSRKCLILDVVRSVVYLWICIMWYAGMPFRKCRLLSVWLLSVPRNSVLVIIHRLLYVGESYSVLGLVEGRVHSTLKCCFNDCIPIILYPAKWTLLPSRN